MNNQKHLCFVYTINDSMRPIVTVLILSSPNYSLFSQPTGQWQPLYTGQRNSRQYSPQPHIPTNGHPNVLGSSIASCSHKWTNKHVPSHSHRGRAQARAGKTMVIRLAPIMQMQMSAVYDWTVVTMGTGLMVPF